MRLGQNEKVLTESRPKVLFEPAPCIWLKPTLLKDMNEYKHYPCPVYRTAERRGVLATTGHSTNMMMKIRRRAADHGTMRRVHLLALRLIGREIVREDDENIALIATHCFCYQTSRM